MQFGFHLPNNQGVARVADIVDFARLAEDLGYDSVWVSEHLFHASYVRERLGQAPYHEPLTILTAVAAVTKRVRLGTSVLVLPWHHPVRLAKVTATLDHYSNGRLILGVGVGAAADEYAALGVPFTRRGAIADEMLTAMRALWTQPTPAHRGRFFSFDGLYFEPKCLQNPHIPLWVGGNSDAAIARVVRFGQGWQPLSLSANDLKKGRDRIGNFARPLEIAPRVMLSLEHEPWDRPVEERRTAKGTVTELRAMMRAYESAGATHMIIDANVRDLAETRRLMTAFKREVVEHL